MALWSFREGRIFRCKLKLGSLAPRVRISLLGRIVPHSLDLFLRCTEVSNNKIPPKIAYLRKVVKLTCHTYACNNLTIFLNMQCIQSPETEITQICWNRCGKIREMTSGKLNFGGFLVIWNLCSLLARRWGSWCGSLRLVAFAGGHPFGIFNKQCVRVFTLFGLSLGNPLSPDIGVLLRWLIVLQLKKKILFQIAR